jgi:hypothetical protein
MEGDPAAAKSDLAFPKVPRAFVQDDRAVASSPVKSKIQVPSIEKFFRAVLLS